MLSTADFETVEKIPTNIKTLYQIKTVLLADHYSQKTEVVCHLCKKKYKLFHDQGYLAEMGNEEPYIA